MKLEYCKIEAFSVIGKEGSTKDGEGFVKKLYDELHEHIDEISSLAKKDENGTIISHWGLMSDFGRNLKPWENWFQEGLYLAGVEVKPGSVAPKNWVKWDVPEREYVCVEVEDGKYNDVFCSMVYYQLDYNLYDLVGAACDFYCPFEKKNYIFFPVKKRVITVKEENETEKIARCGNHCGYCFFNKCGGCDTPNDFCSFASIQPDHKCENVVCSKEKNLKGCYECLELEHCKKGFFGSNDSSARAASIFIQRVGLETSEKTMKNMIKQGINVSKTLAELGNDEARLAFFYKNLK